MKKVAFTFVAALAAVLVTLGFAPSATAYPDARMDLSVDRQVLYSGGSFTATATANLTCAWNLTWNSVTRDNTSATYVTTYVAPAVTRITRIPLTGTCTYAAPTSGTSARTAATAATWHRTTTITVLPRGSAAAAAKGSGSNLPNTGGPDELVLFAGLALLLAGAGAVKLARRRAEGADLADLSGQTA